MEDSGHEAETPLRTPWGLAVFLIGAYLVIAYGTRSSEFPGAHIDMDDPAETGRAGTSLMGAVQDGRATMVTSDCSNLRLYANSTLRFSVKSQASRETTLHVRARGTPVDNSYPLLMARVNGTYAGHRFIARETWAWYTFQIRLLKGVTHVDLAFVNDEFRYPEDRNLDLSVCNFGRMIITIPDHLLNPAPCPAGTETALLLSDQPVIVSGDDDLWTFWSNGSRYNRLDCTQDATWRIVVRARGDQCHGSPRMRIMIGDDELEPFVVGSGKTETYMTAPFVLSRGEYDLFVIYDNDVVREGDCDRNLYVHELRVEPVEDPAP